MSLQTTLVMSPARRPASWRINPGHKTLAAVDVDRALTLVTADPQQLRSLAEVLTDAAAALEAEQSMGAVRR